MSANLWMDLLEPTTSAIVNTDYRLGMPHITFLHVVDKGFFNNYSIHFLPLKHESTHQGDELTIQRKDMDYALKRVNVSYEYAEFKFTVNEPLDRQKQCHSFRAGVLVNYKTFYDEARGKRRSAGWYFVDEREGQLDQIPGTTDNITWTNQAGKQSRRGPGNQHTEWYLQYQYQSPVARCGIQGIASVEYRNGVRYGYDLSAKAGDPATTATGDFRANSVNAFVGMRFHGARETTTLLNHLSVGVRGYYGNCPYGQFRSVSDFSQVGICVIFE